MTRRKVRVNLGSGGDYLENWVNVDIDSTQKVDVIADLNKKFPFKDDSIDEIKASDILEHFTKEGGAFFISECARVLKKGGLISLRTHNVFQIYKQFSKDPEVLLLFLYGQTKKTGVFGSHKYGYTKKSLIKILRKYGFSVGSINKETTNFEVIARKIGILEKKLKIAIVQQAPDIGGAEEYTILLTKHFKNRGHKVFFATNNLTFEKLVAKNAVKTFRIPFRLDIIGNYRGLLKSFVLLPYAVFFYIKLLRKFRKNKVDVILMSGFSEKMLVTFLSIFYKIPVVWIEFGPLKTIFERNFKIPKLTYTLNRIAKKVIVPAENTRLDLIKAGVSDSKITILPCGIEIPNNQSKTKNADIVIGNVSRLTREKGQEFLILAAPSVLKKHPKTKFVLVGAGQDKKYYEDLIKKLKLTDSFTVTDFVDNVSKYYDKFDVFVFPTIWDLEGFGLVLAEAMAHKIPIIANNFGPVPEVVGNAGILVKPKDTDALSEAIIELINNKKMRDKLGQEGYKKVVNNYNIKMISKQILDIIKDEI